MSYQLVIGGGVILLLIIAVYLSHLWFSVKRTSDFVVRWYLALTEAPEFFSLLDHSSEHSHFMDRHGPVLNSDDILGRALDGGIVFSGVKGKAVASSRWLSHHDLLRAIDSAFQHYMNGVRPKGGAFFFQFGHIIGEGYLKGRKSNICTRSALVVIKKNEVITAFPVLKPDKTFASKISTIRNTI